MNLYPSKIRYARKKLTMSWDIEGLIDGCLQCSGAVIITCGICIVVCHIEHPRIGGFTNNFLPGDTHGKQNKLKPFAAQNMAELSSMVVQGSSQQASVLTSKSTVIRLLNFFKSRLPFLVHTPFPELRTTIKS